MDVGEGTNCYLGVGVIPLLHLLRWWSSEGHILICRRRDAPVGESEGKLGGWLSLLGIHVRHGEACEWTVSLLYSTVSPSVFAPGPARWVSAI